MTIALASGVTLNVIPTTQFKTTRIAVHFLAPADASTYAVRTLLTSVLETSSADFPTQAALSAQLETMYGADFGIGVAKEGAAPRVTATLELVANRMAQQDLLETGLAFLHTVLTRPLLTNGRFDPAVVAREQHNLIDYLNSLDEDRQLQASLATQQLYFTDAAQATPSFGTAAAMAAVTPDELWSAYQSMLQNDQIQIVVLGDVDEGTVVARFKEFALAPRPATAIAMSYDQALLPLKSQTITAPVLQAKLNVSYHIDFDLYGARYYAALVAIELFGGSPLSFLFTNVREKASMAYYASADLDAFRHYAVVQTGIDAENKDQVLDLIQQQLDLVRNGKFSDAMLQNIKDGLLNARLTAYDSPRFLARQALLDALIPSHTTDFSAYKEAVLAVSREQVQEAARSMQPQTVVALMPKEEA